MLGFAPIVTVLSMQRICRACGRKQIAHGKGACSAKCKFCGSHVASLGKIPFEEATSIGGEVPRAGRHYRDS